MLDPIPAPLVDLPKNLPRFTAQPRGVELGLFVGERELQYGDHEYTGGVFLALRSKNILPVRPCRAMPSRPVSWPLFGKNFAPVFRTKTGTRSADLGRLFVHWGGPLVACPFVSGRARLAPTRRQPLAIGQRPVGRMWHPTGMTEGKVFCLSSGARASYRIRYSRL